MTSDHIKTIREALDEYHASLREGITQRYASELYNEARAALDSLETELAEKAERVEYLTRRVIDLDVAEGELTAAIAHSRDLNDGCSRCLLVADAAEATLRTRLAPADSPPGDDIELEALIRTAADIGHYNAGPAEDEAFAEVCRLARAGFAHLRSQQPETEEQRAERLLGAFLVKEQVFRHTTFQHADTKQHWCVLKMPDGTIHRQGRGSTRAAAILDALAKARDAEGGK